MALGTYSELQSTVLSAMARDETDSPHLAAYLPVAIALTEAKINRKLRVGDMEASTTLTGSSGVFTLPEDYAAFRDVSVPSYGPLSLVTPDWASENYPTSAGGAPKFFTVQGDTLTTYPAASSLSLKYYARIPALSDSNTTNWLLERHPDLYFFWVLCEAYAFIKDAETALVWNQRGAASIEEINTADLAARYSRVSARTKGPTP